MKRSAEQVAEALDLSRYTIFSYLKEIRHGDVAGERPLRAADRPASAVRTDGRSTGGNK